MSTNYKVKVNKVHEFDINKKDLLALDSIKIDENKYHLLHDKKPFQIEVLKSDFNKKQYVLKINQKKFQINISDHLDQLINKMGFALGSTKNINAIKAPMPGLILEVKVKKGQNIKENDPLLILEAMKMENVITAPRDGIIKSIFINKGDTAVKGTLLIELEP